MYRSQFDYRLFLQVGAVLVAFTGASLAEDKLVGAQTVAEKDLIVVQVHCADLLRREGEAVPEQASPGFTASGGSTGPEGGEIAGDPAGGTALNSGVGEGGSAGSTIGADDAPALDLASITLENCRAAGLIN